MDNPSDIFSLCRLCLVKDQVNISIFDEQGDIRQIFLKISSCLPIKVSRDDKLPKKICDDCSNKLDLLYEFWNSSANAEKTLLSWLGQAGVKDAGGTINAVAQQIAKPTETLVKLESGVVEGNSVLISPCVNSVDNESFNELPKEESEAAPPPPKRTRRSAAVKAQINIIPESEDDDDIDTTDLPTKLEDGPEDSDAEDKDPSYTEVPGTSANDQPGPSGVGKAGGVEAPINSTPACAEEIIRILSSSDENPISENEDEIPKKLRKILRCHVCNKDFIHLANLEEHLQVHGTYNCTECLLVFKSKNQLDEHNLNRHSGDPKLLQCTICNLTLPTIMLLSIHNFQHTGEYKCFKAECNFIAKKKYFFINHLEKHDGKFLVSCKICGLGFRTKAAFDSHYEMHEAIPKYFCEYCPKVFTLKNRLSAHQRLNHKKELFGKDDSFQCEVCGRKFTTENSLIMHLSSIHKIGKDYSVDCPVCNKKIANNRNLNKHMRIHTGEKRFCCEICGMAFLEKRYLQRHQPTHNKSRNNSPKIKKSPAESTGKIKPVAKKSFIWSMESDSEDD